MSVELTYGCLKDIPSPGPENVALFGKTVKSAQVGWRDGSEGGREREEEKECPVLPPFSNRAELWGFLCISTL